MDPLIDTDGVIFPYVPTVRVAHSARYGSQPLTHTNYNNYFYEGSEVTSMLISGEFSVQSPLDAKYFMAALYFFRAATKMFYGDSGAYQGAPPPIVYLDGYGQHYLPHVPCVITNFAHTMPADVDYVPMILGNNIPNRVPTLSTFEVTLQPVYSRSRQREFNYDSFAKGEMINKGMI
jgi:hypothetical protein